MKHIVWKAYWDFEREEQWLNEMAARGLSLSDYSWCRYVFEDTPPGKYLYRIELLRYTPAHPESAAYLRFLEENGVEHVTSYLRWVYLRKPAAEGAFDLYTDADSRLRFYRRVRALWAVLMWIYLTMTAVYAGSSLFYLLQSPADRGQAVTILCYSLVFAAFTLLFYHLQRSPARKIRLLRQEKTIRE